MSRHPTGADMTPPIENVPTWFVDSSVVTIIVLQRSGIDAVIGEFEAAGVAEHVRMNGKGKFSQFSSPTDHFEEPGPRHRAAAFGIEDEAHHHSCDGRGRKPHGSLANSDYCERAPAGAALYDWRAAFISDAS